MNYKLVTEAELPQVMELWDYCFEKKEDPFFQWYFREYCLTHNLIMGGFSEATNRLVNMLHLNPYRILLRGREEVVPYIVGVATDPAARGQELTKGLLQASFHALHDRMSPFALLMPIYAGIYQKYDFAFCYQKHVYEMPLDRLEIPSPAGDLRIERYASYTEELFDSLYGALSDGYNGLPIRTAFQWDKLLTVHQLEKMQAAVVYYGDRPRGYMFYQIREDKTFFIQELIALTPAAKRALLHFAKAHRSAADKLYWEATEDDLTWLDFPDAALCGSLKPFMMARCFDTYRALREYEIPADCPDGRITLLVRDGLLDWNNCLVTLSVEAGRFTVEKTAEQADAVLSAGAFTQLYFGAFTTSQLVEADKLKLRSYLPEAFVFLDNLFPKCVNFINEYY
jgi:intracellular survival-like acetyltransferase i